MIFFMDKKLIYIAHPFGGDDVNVKAYLILVICMWMLIISMV